MNVRFAAVGIAEARSALGCGSNDPFRVTSTDQSDVDDEGSEIDHGEMDSDAAPKPLPEPLPSRRFNREFDSQRPAA